ncbi:LbtU family siderophore porin [Alienimonas sp. DA493]|uniref:LbtU family siderophore porin n=1 Tax=Alienimonas sp. DA493 TaxID=3373605 RepID=UPI003755109E
MTAVPSLRRTPRRSALLRAALLSAAGVGLSAVGGPACAQDAETALPVWSPAPAATPVAAAAWPTVRGEESPVAPQTAAPGSGAPAFNVPGGVPSVGPAGDPRLAPLAPAPAPQAAPPALGTSPSLDLPQGAYGGGTYHGGGYVGAPALVSGRGGVGSSFVQPCGCGPVCGPTCGTAGSHGLIAPPPLACEEDFCGRLYGADAGPVVDPLSAALAVRLDTPTSAALLDFQNRQTDKQLILLGSIPSVVPRPILVPGAQLRLSGLLGRTNTSDKFGYLGRFPTDFNGHTAGDLRILQANLAATAYFTPWASGYVETLFSDVFTFPSFNQGSFQVRQAYATFGDVRTFPLYAYIGKKNVSFGDFSTLSPFTQAVPWHYFAALGEGAGVGFVQGGLHVVLTGLAGGRGIRTVDSEATGKVNNFAVNASYAGRVGELEYLFGGGYLDGTIYDAATPEHIDPTMTGPEKNGVWDVNGTLHWRRYTLAGEYVQTLRNWPVTDYEVSAWKAESAMDVSALGRPLRLSTSYSVGKQAQDGEEWDRNAQLVLGAGWQLNPNALLSLEYVRSIGFAPLIGLTAPGVSDTDVRQNSVVLGVSLVL